MSHLLISLSHKKSCYVNNISIWYNPDKFIDREGVAILNPASRDAIMNGRISRDFIMVIAIGFELNIKLS